METRVSSNWVVDVTDETFETEVLERSKSVPVVVDFWAEWCGPCRILGPILEKIANEAQGKFVLAKLDTERAPLTSQAFGIRSIPTVFAFKDGAPGESFAGALPEAAVREFIDRLVPSQNDEWIERADGLRSEDPAEAESLYRKVIASDPRHEAARLGLAEVLFERGDRDGTSEIVEGLLPAAGPFAERIEHLRSELALHALGSERSEEELRALLESNASDGEVLMELGQVLAAERRYAEALEALLDAARSDRALATGRAKGLMVDIFHAVGIRSDIADEYRTKLSRLLY